MQKLKKEFGRASSPVWFLDWKNSEITTVYSLFFKTTLLLVFQENCEAHCMSSIDVFNTDFRIKKWLPSNLHNIYPIFKIPLETSLSTILTGRGSATKPIAACGRPKCQSVIIHLI